MQMITSLNFCFLHNWIAVKMVWLLLAVHLTAACGSAADNTIVFQSEAGHKTSAPEITSDDSAKEKSDAEERQDDGIELRLVEKKHVEGITENKGFQKSDDPDDLVYPHSKPVIVLKSGHADVKIKEFEFDTGAGPKTYYMVTLHLTEKAREQLASKIEGDEMRMLTARVDGKYRGVQRYEKDKNKKFVPKTARADSFTFNLGMFLSKQKVEQIEALLD